MKYLLIISTLLLCSLACTAQVRGQPLGKPATRLAPIETLMRDSVGPDDVAIGVEVDSLCRMGRKRIVSDIPNGCAAVAMYIIDDRLELELMKLRRFDCEAKEVMLVFTCEPTD